MNIQNIYELMERFEGSSMTEMTVELEGAKVTFKKGGCQTESPAAVREKQLPVQEETGAVIEAPLVGTFYAAPSPEEEPFVREGQEVKKGDVVGIIEAMKLMNEITAPCDGIIEKIAVENGQMVEYHQMLMRVKEK